MPLMIVPDDFFDAVVGNEVPPVIEESEEATIEDMNIGRGPVNEVPESLRNVIAECALTDSNKNVAETFGVSPSSVSAYKHGATSTATYNQPDAPLQRRVIDVRERITKRASSTIMQALRGITPSKLEDVKVRDLAAIAKDMSAVIKNMEPPADEREQGKGVQFVFYSPQIKKEADYEVIDISSKPE